MYFLKSAACLAVLMLFYKLLLEKENMHVFKRFYLLTAVVISFVVPFITFTTYVESVSGESVVVYEPVGGSDEKSALKDFLPHFWWSFYVLGILFFGIKFFLNLRTILLRIKRNPKDEKGCATNVLLKEEVVPHTFWNYIFVNKRRYAARSIPPEVFEHERAHVRQRHTADILFIEFLQVIIWFNPLIYIVRHSIKLNHEFLADRAVLQKGIQTAAYQHTLLTFSSGALAANLANSINYSSIKKRFTVMKTHTSKTAIWARSLLLLPLLVVLIYSCSTNEEVEKPIDDPALHNQSKETATPEMIREYNRVARKYNSQGDRLVDVGDYNDMRQIYDLMSPEQRKTVESFPKVEVIEVVEDEIITTQTLTEYNNLANFYNKNGVTNENVEDANFKRMMYLYGIMTPQQRETVVSLPPPPPPAPALE